MNPNQVLLTLSQEKLEAMCFYLGLPVGSDESKEALAAKIEQSLNA
jgi:hypothetical protein